MIAFTVALAAAAAPAAATPPPVPAASPAATDREQEIRAAIESGRLTQAELMLGPQPADSGPELGLFADLRLAQKRFAEAIPLLQKATVEQPQDPHPVSRLGIALLEVGRTGEAEAMLVRATALPGADWRTWNALGIAYDRRGAWPESRNAYARALQLAPDQPAILNNAGYSLLLQKRPQEARAFIARARALGGGDVRIAVNAELADAMNGAYPTARGAGESDHDWAARLNNAGYAAFLAGDLAGARSLFARAIEASDTRYEVAEHNLARVERAMGTKSP